MQTFFQRRTFGALLFVVLLAQLCFQFSRVVTTFSGSAQNKKLNDIVNSLVKDNKEGKGNIHRITKVSVVYGQPNALYEGAIRSHQRHADRWGYELQVLRQEIVGGVWDKVSYLLSLVLQELAKPPEERREWLWWVDADSIILNTEMPVDTFLPPDDMKHIHMVSTKDHNGLNAGILIFRVHLWTVNFLVETLGYPLFLPNENLGAGLEQEAMARVLQKKQYREGNIYIPRKWINTYEFHHAYEGKEGDMLVHFPGLGDAKTPHMTEWLKRIESSPNPWEVPLDKTDYPGRVEAFWKLYRSGWDIVKRTEEEVKKAGEKGTTSARSAAAAELRTTLEEHSEDVELVKKRIEEIKAAIKKEAAPSPSP